MPGFFSCAHRSLMLPIYTHRLLTKYTFGRIIYT
nr:MAG TPA: hypothetical protein [Bacteriophage sp.]